jgi:hypothetical protein
VRVAGDVDQQISENAIDEPWGRGLSAARQLSKRELDLVDRIVPRLVDPRRLRGRPNEAARKTGTDSDDGC